MAGYFTKVNEAISTGGASAFRYTTGSIGDAVIIASTNDVYYWDNGGRRWVLHTAKASTLFGVGYEGTNRRNGTKWIVTATNTIPLTI